MTNSAIQEKAIDTIFVMNTAITDFRLYPPGSAVISNVIDRVHQAILSTLDKEAPLIFAESEKNLLIGGEPLSEKDQKKPQVMAFLETLLNLGIKSIAFEKGLQKSELIDLLDIMNNKPADLEEEGGLQQVVSNKNMVHILLDQKIYVALEKDKQIIASMDIKDEDIVKFVMGDIPYSDIDLQKVREMSKDPEWAARLFQAGADNVMKLRGTISDTELSETCVHMIHVLDDITDTRHKEKISQSIAGSIANVDDKLLAKILTQNLEDIIGAGLFEHIINKLDDEKYERLTDLIKNMADAGTDGGGRPGQAEIESINKAYMLMINSERREQLLLSSKDKETHEKEKKEKQAVAIQEGLSSIMKGENGAFVDKQVMQFLPSLIGQLFSKGKSDSAWTIINKLGHGLLSKKPDVRAQVSQAFSRIGEKLLSEHGTREMTRLSDKLISWIKLETTATPAYKQICIQLQGLAQKLIRNNEFAECDRILETFNLIYSGEVKKNEAIQALSGHVLDNIATDEILDILFNELQTNETQNRKQVIKSLGMIGATPVERLLRVLQESEDSAERLRIIRVVSEIGHPAAPALISHIEQGGHWYYIRNLIAMLGKVGTEADVQILQPFLGYKDFRVQLEAARSICNMGGDSAGEILLSALKESDERLNIRIVTMLGTMKYRNAVFPLLELLGSKSLISSKLRVDLEVNICIALGHMGAQEAIPELDAIVEQKSLLGIKSYNEKVKIAAGKALAMIRKTTYSG